MHFKIILIVFFTAFQLSSFAQNVFPQDGATSGGVGIGTTTPQHGYLHLTGDGASSGINLWTNTGSMTSRIWIDSPNKLMHISRGSDPTMGITLDNHGKIGIGTTSFDSRFEIKHSGTIGAKWNPSASFLKLTDGTISLIADGNEIYSNQALAIGSSYNDPIFFRNVNSHGMTDLMTIKENGNVSIGTSESPTRLTVFSGESKMMTFIRSGNSKNAHIGYGAANGGGIYLGTDDNQYALWVQQNGHVGVGIYNPEGIFSVKSAGTIGPAGDYSKSSVFITDGNQKMGIDPNQIFAEQDINVDAKTFIKLNTNRQTRMQIFQNGSIGINTSSTGTHQLAVGGTIGAREIKVQANGWSDFVFKEDYKLPTLEEVEQHIDEKGHLPEIPSEAEVAENGINLGEMNAKLLQKIEELTLYLIDQNKQNKAQQSRIEQLEKELIALKKQGSSGSNDTLEGATD